MTEAHILNNLAPSYDIVWTEQQLSDLLDSLREHGSFAFDLETTSLDTIRCGLVGISFSVDPSHAWYVPVGHYEPGSVDLTDMATDLQPSLFGAQKPVLDGRQLAADYVLDEIREIMADDKIGKIAHNAPFDGTVLLNLGVSVQAWEADTYAAAWYQSTGFRKERLGLKALVKDQFDYDMANIESLIGPKKLGNKRMRQATFAEVPVEDASSYAAEDAAWTLRLWYALKPGLEKLGLMSPLWEIDMKLIEIVCHMEVWGIAVDREFATEFMGMLDVEIKNLQEKANTIVGDEAKLRSTHWLSSYLFDVLGMPKSVTTMTKTGHYSVDQTALDKLVELDKSGFVDVVLQYRGLYKLRSTYIPPLFLDYPDGRVHPRHLMLGAGTGRFAAVDPNVQNIPARSRVGVQIRKAYVAPPGFVFLALDYSQIELRVLAHMSKDQWMQEAFRMGRDIHTLTASEIFVVPADLVTPDQRRMAKAVNFGLAYGAGPQTLVYSTGVTLQEAKDFRNKYFQRAPGVKWYMDTISTVIKTRGWVKTMFGRRIYTDRYTVAVNHPIQGTAADIIRKAMVTIFPYCADYSAKLILQIHDELVFELPEDRAEAFKPVVKEVMENAVKLRVPLLVSTDIGRNLYEIKE